MIIKHPFDISMNVIRAGVIPYTIYNGKLHFMMGIDYKSGDWTDFGGGVKLNETSIEGAFREFREETNCIFPEKLYNCWEMTNSLPVIHKNMMIVFLPIDSHWVKKAQIKFFYKRKIKNYNEIYNIRWIEETRFRYKILNNDEIFYKKVLKFLNNFCIYEEFYETLRENF